MRNRTGRLGAFGADIEGYQFFHSFSGQARTKWHCGAAHGNLCDIEDAWVTQHGRHWLKDEAQARTYLVLGKPKGGLDWLDYREITQITAAFTCVLLLSSVHGAYRSVRRLWVLDVEAVAALCSSSSLQVWSLLRSSCGGIGTRASWS